MERHVTRREIWVWVAIGAAIWWLIGTAVSPPSTALLLAAVVTFLSWCVYNGEQERKTRDRVRRP